MTGGGTCMTLSRAATGLVRGAWWRKGAGVTVCACVSSAGDQDSIHYMCKEAPATVLELESYG
jgi:hypothetical protein